jgi:DNA-directed RNA polymerase specialized sigma24 family protein
MAEPAAVERLDLETAINALLALTVADREARVDDTPLRRSELVLANAGLSYSQISRLTGRNYETVKTAVRRAREAEEKATNAKKNGR